MDSQESEKRLSTNPQDYKLYEEIGEGVSATVYRALYVPFNEIVAIKVLDLEKCNNDLVLSLSFTLFWWSFTFPLSCIIVCIWYKILILFLFMEMFFLEFPTINNLYKLYQICLLILLVKLVEVQLLLSHSWYHSVSVDIKVSFSYLWPAMHADR